VMNGSHIGSGSLVAAGAVVTQGTVVPPGSLVAGVPARVLRPVTDDDLAYIRAAAVSYTDRLPDARGAQPLTRESVAGGAPTDPRP
jgi:carbonic anhydrase/acetyltransferase-like protein (isoleucine patch superfamily)